MPPPVSSEDLRKSASISPDEFGAMAYGAVSAMANREDGNTHVGIVRRALKAMSVKR